MDQVEIQIFPFLSLPPEIRNEIYRYLLSTKYTKRIWGLSPSYRFLVKLRSQHSYEFHTDILCVNRQVYQEGTSIFYGENLFIRLVTNVKRILNLYHKVGVQPIARGQRVGNFERGAMTMTITKDGDNRKEESFEVFACDDLDVWCYGLSARILASSGIPASRIAVSIHGSSEGRIHELRESAPSALSKSGRLLEPFTKFHSFGNLRFSITGPVNAQYKDHIEKQVNGPAPSLESAIPAIMALKNEGNTAFRNNQPALAIKKFEAALVYLYTNAWDLKVIIPTGDLANLRTYDVFCAMQFQVQSDFVAVLFETNSFDDCCYWARAAYNVYACNTVFRPRLEDFAMVVFHHFFASLAMGEADTVAAWGLQKVVAMLKKELVVLDRKLEVMRQQGLTTST